MFENQGWEFPESLVPRARPQIELTLWKGCELFMNYPDTKRSKERDRYASCFVHLVTHFGKDCTVKSIWVPQIKHYIAERMNAGVLPSQVNREKGTLSKMFQVLNEPELIQENPCRLIPNLSQKSEERMVYLSFQAVRTIVEGCPTWLKPIVWTGYYCGMRQGEILGLSRSRLKLSKRMVSLGPEDIKEGHWKRVPLHVELIPILQEIMKVRRIGTDKVFTKESKPIERHLIRPAWIVR
jgi:integrase